MSPLLGGHLHLARDSLIGQNGELNVTFLENELPNYPYQGRMQANILNPFSIGSMYGLFTYIYHNTIEPNVGKYTVHGSVMGLSDLPSGFCAQSTLVDFFSFRRG